MAYVLEEFGLPEDIWLMIEEINNNIQHDLVLNQLKITYEWYWREKYRNYENRFFSGFQKNKFSSCGKYFTHDMHLPRQNQRNSPYHLIYNDHFNIIKFQGSPYKDFYFNNKRKLFH